MIRCTTTFVRRCLLDQWITPQPFTACVRSASQFKRNIRVPVVNAATSGSIHNLIPAENRSLDCGEWQTLRDRLLDSDRTVSELNVDATIMGRCLTDGLLEMGKSYVGFLRSTDRPTNLATLGRLLRLYHQAAKTAALGPNDRADIVRICDDLQRATQTYDSITSEAMLHALVATDEWPRAVALLDTVRLTARPSTSAFSVIAERAFAERRTDIGWQMLRDCVAVDRIPKCEALLAYWTMCGRMAADSDRADIDGPVTEMLRFIGQNDLVVSRRVVDALAELCERHLHRQCQVTDISKNGRCPSCRNQLSSVFLTNKEFKQISAVFLERVLVKGDVFLKSSPAEVEKFEQFLASQAPFDCVIDGLNVAYSTGNSKPNAYYGKLLASVVRYFVEKQRRVLVLGRRHMLKWPKASMGYIQSKASLFLTDDLSQDDPFLLYATLKSGPSTDFVSRDLMRGHAFLLGAELKPVFRRWQQEHQYYLDVRSHAGNVDMREPLKFQTAAHTSNGTWHVPFVPEYDPCPADRFALPRSWLCIAARPQTST